MAQVQRFAQCEGTRMRRGQKGGDGADGSRKRIEKNKTAVEKGEDRRGKVR